MRPGRGGQVQDKETNLQDVESSLAVEKGDWRVRACDWWMHTKQGEDQWEESQVGGKKRYFTEEPVGHLSGDVP